MTTHVARVLVAERSGLRTTGFQFKANDGVLDSPVATNLISVGSAIAPPSAPTGLTATAVSRSQISLDPSGVASSEGV